MATKKHACLKRGKHNKCLKRAGSKAKKGHVHHGRHRCRTAKGKFKKCGR